MSVAVARRSRRRLLLLVVVLAMVAYLVLTDEQGRPDVVPAVARAPAASSPLGAGAAPRTGSALPAPGGAIIALMPRPVATRVEDAFATRSWRKPAVVLPVVPQAAVAPSAPPLPYVFLGKELREGQWLVFLGLQERTLIVKEGDAIDGVWRVGQIKPPSMGVLHVATGQQRVLAIGEGH